MRHGTHLATGRERFAWSCRALASLLNARSSTMAQPRQRFSEGEIVDELVKGLDGRLDQRFGQRGSFSILTFPYKGEPQQAGAEEKTDTIYQNG